MKKEVAEDSYGARVFRLSLPFYLNTKTKKKIVNYFLDRNILDIFLDKKVDFEGKPFWDFAIRSLTPISTTEMKSLSSMKPKGIDQELLLNAFLKEKDYSEMELNSFFDRIDKILWNLILENKSANAIQKSILEKKYDPNEIARKVSGFLNQP